MKETDMRVCFLARLFVMAVIIIQAETFYQVRADEPQEWTFAWHKSEVTGLAFTPDGTKLITTSLRDDRISRIVSGEDQANLTGDSAGVVTGARSHAVAVSPDGNSVAIAGFRVTSMHDLTMPRELWNLSTLSDEYSPPYVMAVAFSPDGRWLATSGSSSKVGGPHGYKGGLITIRDAKSGKELHRFDDLSHASDSIAYSPDGKLFVAGTVGAGGELPEPGELRIWDTSDWKLLHVWKAKDSVLAGQNQCSVAGIAFTPDSSRLALAISDGTVRLWDVVTRKPSAEF
jgi:WD40 repeat protein